MNVEMITHPSLVSGVVFYILAGIGIAAATGSITLVDQRRSAWMFTGFCATLAVLATLEGATIPALVLTLVGIVTLSAYMKIHHRQSDKQEPAMEDGPSRPLALFIALCLLTALTPIWTNSIWKSHQASALQNNSVRIWELVTHDYLETTVLLVLAGAIAILFLGFRSDSLVAETSHSNESPEA